jgi:hypothetical protein
MERRFCGSNNGSAFSVRAPKPDAGLVSRPWRPWLRLAFCASAGADIAKTHLTTKNHFILLMGTSNNDGFLRVINRYR